MLKRVVLLLSFALTIACANAQTEQFHVSYEGIPASKFLFESQQVWDVAQDTTGLLYVAGSNLFEYDGISHRIVANEVMRSLEVSPEGRIYGGGVGEFGYVNKDTLGYPYFHSLAGRLSDSEEIDQIEAVLIENSIVYFAGSNTIYQYDEIEDTLSVLPTPTRAYPLFTFRGKVFSMVNDRGIFEIQRDTLVYFPDQPSLAGMGATSVLAYEDSLILLSADFGSMVLKNGEYQPLDLIDKSWLIENVLYRVQEISEDFFCFSFLKGGAVITDKLFRPIVRFDESQGFDDQVYSVVKGRENELFLCTNNGVFVLDLNSHITYHSPQTGLKGLVTDIEEIGLDLYVSTFDGIYQTRWLTNEDPTKTDANRFQKVMDSEIYSYDLLPTANGTLVNAYQGVGVITQGKYSRLISKLSSNGFVTFSPDSTLILATGDAGNEVLVLSEGIDDNWVLRNRIDTRDHAALFNGFRKIQWDEKLNKYWGTTFNSVFTIEFDASLESLVGVQFYDESNGLPAETGNTVVRLGNEIRFLTNFGLYAYDIPSGKFVKDDRFGNLFDEAGFYLLSKKNEHEYWYVSRDGTRGLIYRKDTSDPFQLASKSASHLSPNEQILIHTKDAVLIGGYKGIARIGNPLEVSYESSVPVLIRQVSTFNNQRDSVISYGTEQLSIPGFSRESNSFRFKYSWPYFIQNQYISYAYKLKGYEELWSQYSDQVEKEYTNLPSGDYTMMVKARNVYGSESPVGEFSFQIRKAWYETIWAYLSYAVLFIGTIWGAVQINARRLKSENEKLEQKINERTEEVKLQANKIQELDRVKTRFFSNISHEFRTPLTLIQGPIESILLGKVKGQSEVEQNLNVAKRNVNTLRHLIDEILEFNKMETGELTIETRAVELRNYLEDLSDSFQMLAAEHGVAWELIVNFDHDLRLDLPVNYIEKVINNLVSNAMKHTPPGSKVMLNIRFEDQLLNIAVTDQGSGIPEEELDKIFERFYQSSNGKHIAHSSGIGLAFVREIATALGGDIRVKSEEGLGSTFTFSIPAEISSGAERMSEPSDEGMADKIPGVYPYENNKILITEDNEELSNYIAQILGSQFEIETAANGQEALDKLERFEADLIISDIMMPVMDGMELLHKIKSHKTWKYKSMVMLTAKSSHEVRLEALSFGLDDYLTKPFSPTELEIRIKNILKNQYERRKWLSKEGENEAEDPFIRDLISEIEINIDNKNFGVLNLSEKASLSDRQLTRVVRKASGLTPAGLIREVKLNKAKHYLESKTYRSVSEVAYAVGFEKPAHFSKIYFERFGKKPSEYLA